MAKSLTLLAALFFLFCTGAQAAARTVTDAFGRTVAIPAPEEIHRIVALGSSMAFVTYVGAQHLAVGVEDIDKRQDMAKPYILRNRELVKDLPVVGKAGAVRIPDYERIIGLKPQVVFIVSTDTTEPDLLQRKLRIPVVAVSQGLHQQFEEAVFLQSIRLTGEVLGRERRAEELVHGIQALADKLHYRPAPEQRVRAYAGGLSYKGNQDIKSTDGNFLPFRLASITNVADSTGRSGHCFVNKEFLLAANPDLLFIDGNGLPLIRQDMRDNPQYYQRLAAAASGRIWLLLPHTTYFNNPELLYINAFFMAKAAYPEQYPAMDPAMAADEVFTLFTGAPLYNKMLALSGPVGRLKLTDEGLLHAAP